jgi:hypothetical protein
MHMLFHICLEGLKQMRNHNNRVAILQHSESSEQKYRHGTGRYSYVPSEYSDTKIYSGSAPRIHAVNFVSRHSSGTCYVLGSRIMDRWIVPSSEKYEILTRKHTLQCLLVSVSQRNSHYSCSHYSFENCDKLASQKWQRVHATPTYHLHQNQQSLLGTTRGSFTS